MQKWEYCILSGIETALKRKLAMSLTFSDRQQSALNFEVTLDGDCSEEIFTTRYLGQLGSDGWEVVAFNRSTPRFEAVLKRPVLPH